MFWKIAISSIQGCDSQTYSWLPLLQPDVFTRYLAMLIPARCIWSGTAEVLLQPWEVNRTKGAQRAAPESPEYTGTPKGRRPQHVHVHHGCREGLFGEQHTQYTWASSLYLSLYQLTLCTLQCSFSGHAIQGRASLHPTTPALRGDLDTTKTGLKGRKSYSWAVVTPPGDTPRRSFPTQSPFSRQFLGVSAKRQQPWCSLSPGSKGTLPRIPSRTSWFTRTADILESERLRHRNISSKISGFIVPHTGLSWVVGKIAAKANQLAA